MMIVGQVHFCLCFTVVCFVFAVYGRNKDLYNNNECSLSLSSTLRLQEDCRAVVHVKNLFVNYRQTNDGKVPS